MTFEKDAVVLEKNGRRNGGPAAGRPRRMEDPVSRQR